MKVGDEQHVKLWEAINALVVASGGRADTTSVARQNAVVAVEQVLALEHDKHAEVKTYADAAEGALRRIAEVCGFERKYDYPLQIFSDVEQRMMELTNARATLDKIGDGVSTYGDGSTLPWWLEFFSYGESDEWLALSNEAMVVGLGTDWETMMPGVSRETACSAAWKLNAAIVANAKKDPS